MGKVETLVVAIVIALNVVSISAQTYLPFRGDCTPANADPCNPIKHHKCVVVETTPAEKKMCICDPETAYHNNVTDMCIREANKPCLEWYSGSQYATVCTPNSYCLQDEKDKDGLCTCLPNALESNGLCLGGFNSQCAHSQECATNKYLDCGPNNTCVCREEKMEWNAETSICHSLLGGSCDMAPAGTKKCAGGPGIICEGSLCICNATEGYVVHPEEQRCVKRFGESCTADNQCLPTNVCVGQEGARTCGCDPELITENNVCKQREGKACDAELECHSHSVCNSTTTPPTCTCNDGFAPNSGGVCKLNHGGDCTADNTLCNDELHLVCDGNSARCDCKPNYDYENDKCMGNFDAGCNVPEDCKTGTCEGSPDKKCSCPADTIPGTNTCYLKFDAECSDSIEWQCDPAVYSICTEGQCGCAADSMRFNDACTALVDGSCQDGRKCITNAQCVIGDAGSVCRCSQGYSKNETTSLCVQGGSGSGSWALSGSMFAVVVSIFMALSK